jgi:hypothetical protein
LAVTPLAGCAGEPFTHASALPGEVDGNNRVVVAQGSYTLLNGQEAYARFGRFDMRLVPFSTTRSGDVNVVIDYTHVASEVTPKLFRGSCSEEFAAVSKCDLVAALSSRAKPVVLTADRLPAGTYTLMIQNYAYAAESGTYEITLHY